MSLKGDELKLLAFSNGGLQKQPHRDLEGNMQKPRIIAGLHVVS